MAYRQLRYRKGLVRRPLAREGALRFNCKEKPCGTTVNSHRQHHAEPWRPSGYHSSRMGRITQPQQDGAKMFRGYACPRVFTGEGEGAADSGPPRHGGANSRPYLQGKKGRLSRLRRGVRR